MYSNYIILGIVSSPATHVRSYSPDFLSIMRFNAVQRTATNSVILEQKYYNYSKYV